MFICCILYTYMTSPLFLLYNVENKVENYFLSSLMKDIQRSDYSKRIGLFCEIWLIWTVWNIDVKMKKRLKPSIFKRVCFLHVTFVFNEMTQFKCTKYLLIIRQPVSVQEPSSGLKGKNVQWVKVTNLVIAVTNLKTKN